MIRLLAIGIDCFSALVFIVPAVIVLQFAFFKQHSFSKAIMVFIFAFYSMAVFTVVGIPTVNRLMINLRLNLIPLIDIVNNPPGYIVNTILNIILFMPLGFLLPVIWEEYRPMKRTVFMGLALSIIIEALQIFTFRLTDIDDLITNTLGTILGYYVGKMFSFKMPLIGRVDNEDISTKSIYSDYEPVIILTTVFLIGFFLKTFVSDTIWDIVLSSSLWEHIK